MRSINSRVYTNVILTVIAVLLGVLAFQPRLGFEGLAFAQRDNEEYSRSLLATAGDPLVAGATERVASATESIARAIEQASDSQKMIAEAIELLSQPAEESASSSSGF